MVGTIIDNSANANLKNLTPSGKNISTWCSNASNCIVEIPQDIKLTLSGGTLTLKSGSVITYPDGTKFKLQSDLTRTSAANGSYLLFVRESDGLSSMYTSSCYSGSETPTSNQYMMWYNTVDNTVRYSGNYGSTWSTTPYSFPICSYTVSGGQISSIDQVFNGFGYIGSSLFVLPSVKTLYAQGFNSDGTLKSELHENTSVLTRTETSGTAKYGMGIGPNIGLGDYVYDKDTNYLYFGSISESNKRPNLTLVGTVEVVSGRIKSLDVKKPFHAVDYYDIINVIFKPNYSSAIGITFPDNTHEYTAPSNGYLIMNFYRNEDELIYGYINGSASPFAYNDMLNGQLNMQYLIPLSKGDKFYWNSNMSGVVVNACYFVPCLGV